MTRRKGDTLSINARIRAAEKSVERWKARYAAPISLLESGCGTREVAESCNLNIRLVRTINERLRDMQEAQEF